MSAKGCFALIQGAAGLDDIPPSGVNQGGAEGLNGPRQPDCRLLQKACAQDSITLQPVVQQIHHSFEAR
eukprot:13726430-Alexandrium_andersonii.AAC.1